MFACDRARLSPIENLRSRDDGAPGVDPGPAFYSARGRHTLGVDAYADLVHRESGSRCAAGGLGVGKGGPALAHRGPGLSHFGVGTPAGHILSEYLGGLGKGLLGPAAALGGEDDPVALQLTALCVPGCGILQYLGRIDHEQQATSSPQRGACKSAWDLMRGAVRGLWLGGGASGSGG